MNLPSLPIKALLSVAMVAVLTTSMAWAESIGVVDTDRIGREYKKAQELAKDIRDREKELQTLRTDLAKEYNDKSESLSPVEKKSLEDKLNKQFADKFKEYRDWTLTQEKTIREAVEGAINQVKSKQSMDIIISKAVVLEGGKDVTTDVLGVLNGGASAPAPKK